MKKLLIVASLIITGVVAKAQTTTTTTVKLTDTAKLYHPEADAKAEIAAAVKKAAAEHKNVLLQIGGNWCIWCIRFNDLVTRDPDLNKYVRDNYEIVHVNYSKENMNEPLLAELGYPQRFGFPVFVVLDDKGNRLNTQNSAYLEEGKGHSKEKVMEFFKDWSPAAIDPKSYEKSK
ncbi:MAG TPA: thioredoxin family protein [Mucilaginibacter sp.]|nr:thioredoxin family protein [Mucilaginibacter sp.]